MNSLNKRVYALTCILVLILSIQIGVYADFEGAEENVPKYLELTYPFSYLVDSNGTHAFMYNGTTGKLDYSSSSEISVLQNAINNLTDGGTVYIKPPFELSGTITINKPFISLISDIPQMSTPTYTDIEITRLVINATSNSVYSCRFSGIAFREIYLQAKNSYYIRRLNFDYYGIRPNNQANEHGIIYETDGTSSYCDMIYFTNGYIYSTNTGHSNSDYGAITAIGGILADVHFINLEYYCYNNDSSFLMSRTNAGIWRLKISESCIQDMSPNTGFRFANFLTNGSDLYNGFTLADSIFEVHENLTLVYVGATSNDRRFKCNIHDVEFGIDSGHNLTLMNFVTLDHFRNEPNNFYFHNNGIYGLGGYNTYSGVIPEDANFHLRIHDNSGYNPIGEITNPISNAYLVDSGSGSIANNTVYTVQGSPKTIYMQDGDTFDVKVNGDLVFNDVNSATVTLVSGETFELEWTSALDVLKVYGQ